MSFPHRAKPDDCRKPGWRPVACDRRPTDLKGERIRRCQVVSGIVRLAALKAHDKDGTFKKEFYR